MYRCIDANESEFLLIEKKSCFHPILCGVDRERLEKKKKKNGSSGICEI
jgi:hypothetical protein